MTDLDSSITNVFAADLADLWTHRWEVDILVNQLLAGTPGDPRIIEGYLRGKLRGKDEMAKQAFIARTLHTVQAEVSDSRFSSVTRIVAVNCTRRAARWAPC
jgi:tRNA pseudouridine-54 N-methylase